MENEMYRQAILDAKAVRASAIANAKASLQEAFEPKIQEMLRLKLSEELEDNMEEGDEHYEDSYMSEEAREGVYQDFAEWKKSFPEGTKFENKGGYVMAMDDSGKELGKWNPIQKTGMHADDFQYNNLEEEGTISEADLDEILSELEGLEETEEGSLNENEDYMEEAKDDEGEDDDAEDDDAEAEEPADDEGVDDETKLIEITVGDLKEVLASFMAGQPAEEPMDDEMGDDMGAGGEDDLSLDEILAELEKEDGEHIEEVEEIEEGQEIEEAKGQVPGYGSVGGKGTTGYDEKPGGKGRTGYDAGSKKLHEANKTIEVLSEKLKEINLLNAKLLYMNKIFKSKNLNESQKVSIVKSFDKATSVKEVKNVYEILNESMKNKTKAPLKESFGFASKPAGVAPKRPIVESDPMVDRWQTLVFGNK